MSKGVQESSRTPSPLFGSTENNPRDPMVIQIGGVYYCYYAVSSSTLNGPILGADYCRTSTDLINWSAPTRVAEGGQAGTAFNSAECPFVVQLAPGQYYLFRTQSSVRPHRRASTIPPIRSTSA